MLQIEKSHKITMESEMPTIRITDEHYKFLEGYAITRSYETGKLYNLGLAIGEILEEKKIEQNTKQMKSVEDENE